MPQRRKNQNNTPFVFGQVTYKGRPFRRAQIRVLNQELNNAFKRYPSLVANKLAQELKQTTPVDTGALKKSIRLDRKRRQIKMLFYGIIQNFPGPNTPARNRGWIQRAIRRAIRGLR